MPAKVNLSVNDLDELIEAVEAEEGDATELKKLRAEFPQPQPRQPPSRTTVRSGAGEEETTEERLSREASGLFPEGFSADILAICIEYDGKYSLEELRGMCVEAGLSPSGHKKLLAAKLIANERRFGDGKSGFETGEPVGGEA